MICTADFNSTPPFERSLLIFMPVVVGFLSVISLGQHSCPQVFQEVGQIGDQKLLEAKIADYNKEVSDLWDKLMGLELQLVDQLEVGFFLFLVLNS